MTGVNLRLDWTGLMISGCVQILRITGSSSFVSGLGSFARQGITFLLAFHQPESPAASSFDSATPPRLTGDLRGEIFGRNVTLLCRLFRTRRYLDVHDRGREGDMDGECREGNFGDFTPAISWRGYARYLGIVGSCRGDKR